MKPGNGSPDERYLDRIADLDFDPVFVVGPHRSGTTILYKVLMDTGCFNVTTAYHVLYHDRLLDLHFSGREPEARRELQRRFDERGLRDRQFDSMTISPDIPEEYCYALPRQGRRPMVRDDNLEAFVVFCRKVQLVQDPRRPLLLKNPFDPLNFVYLARVLPRARFIFNHRDPLHVISSQLRTLRALIQHRNEYVALVVERYRELFEQPLKLALARLAYHERLPLLASRVERFIARNCDDLLQNVDSVRDRGVDVRYAELCQDPNRVVGGVLDFLGLRSNAARDLRELVRPRGLELLPEVQRRRRRIERRNAEYYGRFLSGPNAEAVACES